jgi:diacylglycerol O-acyltransferase / wax synthase
MAKYERLSVLDRTFLDFENPNHPQHVGAVLLLDAAPLRHPEGGVDAERIRTHVVGRLHRIPRYRQRLAWIPLENHPVWVDDDTFNIHYHVRHTALPRPGTERQLKRLVARIVSQRLDFGKPLWEMWVVEGLEGDRVVLITKTHHCMVDGIAGVDLLTLLLSPDPEENFEEETPKWLPEKAPGPIDLIRSELWRRAGMPFRAAQGAARALSQPERTFDELREQATALGETLAAGLRPASETPLNRPLGPHRRFDWTRFELARVKAVKNRLGGTVNDVVLATVAGALGAFLERRGVTRAMQRRMDLRAMVPVSVRSTAQRGTPGNQIALWAASLPVGELDPRRRLGAVHEITERLKRSKQAMGAGVLAAVSEWTVPNLLSVASRAAYRNRAANLVVTNVPGPQIPLYLLGARLLEAYPLLNLLTNQSVGVALISYDGGLHWGLMADWDLVPDLHDFVELLEASFEELCVAAELEAPAAPRSARPPGNGSDRSVPEVQG